MVTFLLTLLAADPGAADWAMFPVGTTRSIDTVESLAPKLGPATPPRALEIVRGDDGRVTVSWAGMKAVAPDLRHAALTNEGRAITLVCKEVTMVVHSADLTFTLPSSECSGADEVPRSKAPKKLKVQLCAVAIDGEAESDRTIPIVPGKAVERLDVNADCTMRRAVRFMN